MAYVSVKNEIFALIVRTGLKEDMVIIFEGQIAENINQINEHTRAYVGKLVPGIFRKLPEDIEHIYLSFPKERVGREQVEIGGNKSELENSLIQVGTSIRRKSSFSGVASIEDMLRRADFIVSEHHEEVNLISPRLKDLGFNDAPTIEEIFKRIKELGLKLCPVEAGLRYPLKYDYYKMGGSHGIVIGTEQNTMLDGSQGLLSLWGEDELLMDLDPIIHSRRYAPEDIFVFHIPKKETDDMGDDEPDEYEKLPKHLGFGRGNR